MESTFLSQHCHITHTFDSLLLCMTMKTHKKLIWATFSDTRRQTVYPNKCNFNSVFQDPL